MLRGFFGHSMCYNGRLYEADKGNNATGGQAQTSGANAGAQGTSEGEGAGNGQNTEPGAEGDPAGSGTSAAQDGKQESKDGQPKTQTFTQEQLDAIVEKRLKEKQERDQRAAERDQRKKQDDALVANKQFEELATARGKTIETLESENERLLRENTELRLGSTRATVAAKYKLPARLADRIRGTTEAEMEADAKALAAEIGPPKAPATEGGAGSTAATATATGAGSSDPPPPPAAGQQNGQQQQPLYGWQSSTDVRW